ncbi:MAG: RHS repeat protein [Pyrinomonadaceae bacterium]|nr:RHS repeat protein [Pyrinomonadaceae bacterium]
MNSIYDNRITSTTDVFSHILAYEYELTSTVNQKRLKFDGAMYAVYNFDDADRLTNIVDSNDSTQINFGYDNADRLISKTLPNNITTTYEYDGMSRLKRLKDVSMTATLFDRQYAYNPASQINQIVEPTNTRSFGYDSIDRLKTVTASNNQNENYNYDTVGNRTSSHLSTSYTYQTGQFNRLASTATANYNY